MDFPTAWDHTKHCGPEKDMMQNTLAWRLGIVAKEAGNPNRTDVGDPIDRGLVLLKLLNENGFDLSVKDDAPAWR